MSYTVCKYCLRTVKVTDGKLNQHVPANYKATCKGYKTEALWVEKHALNAMARNSRGVCMRCGETVTNPECHQCCYEKRNES